MSKDRIATLQLDTLEYLQAMLTEMHELATTARCDMLAYMLEMALAQADDDLRGLGDDAGCAKDSSTPDRS